MALKDTYFNISEAAAYLGVTRQTFSRWITEGKIAAEKVGNAILINKNFVYKYENQRAVKTILEAIVKLVANKVRQEFDIDKDATVGVIDYKDARFTLLITNADGTEQEAYAIGEIKIDKERGQLLLNVDQLGLDDVKPKSESVKDSGNKNEKTIK